MTLRPSPGGARAGTTRSVTQDPRYSAARSHELNDKYMNDFEKAWEELSLQQRSTYAQLEEPTLPPRSNPPPTKSISRGASSSLTPLSGQRLTSGASDSRSQTPSRISTSSSSNLTTPRGRTASSSGSTPGSGSGSGYGAGYGSVGNTGAGGGRAAAASAALPDRFPAKVQIGWMKGPVDAAGTLVDVSDRPNTCSAALWSKNEVVIGSTDHALYVIDAAKGLKKRTLYSKTSGHSEWVTSVTYLPDGRIVSGGMDSKLWLWPAGSTRGIMSEGHFGPISKVCYCASSGLVASASYDKTVRLWEFGSRGHEVAKFEGHEAPVLEMEVHPGTGHIVTGDRSGNVLLWDTNAGGGSSFSWRMKHVHQGHITALAWFNEENSPNNNNSGGSGGNATSAASAALSGCFASGGQDGVLRVWDPRARSNLVKLALHSNSTGHGAVGDIIFGGAGAHGYIVTAGADGTVQVVDPRRSFAVMSSTQLTNFPYRLAVAGGIAIAGCGDGSVHFIDIKTGHTMYALGANRAAVRCLECCNDRLVCSGDDGKVVLYSFE